jgi:hypothetical protein
MVAAGQGREFYGSVDSAVRAAAERAVAEKVLEAKDVEGAVECPRGVRWWRRRA